MKNDRPGPYEGAAEERAARPHAPRLTRNPRVCLVGMQNLMHMTGFKPYERVLARMGIGYDVVYVDKYGTTESTSAAQTFPFVLQMDPDWPRWRKVYEYSKFRRHARACLRRDKYDIVITWGLETAILIADILLTGKFKHIINVRDYGPMATPGVGRLVRLLLKRSAMATISSRAFQQWLPPHSYVPISSYQPKASSGFRKGAGPIRVCFLGNVRFVKQDRQLLLSLGNDPRFVIQYFGVGSEVLKRFASEEGITNCEFMGSFDSSETEMLLEQADIINNLYGRGTPDLDTAISLKYYLALGKSLPLLVYSGTSMAYASKGIAFEFDGDYENLANELHAWYEGINAEAFNSAVDARSRLAMDDIVRFEARFTSIMGK